MPVSAIVVRARRLGDLKRDIHSPAGAVVLDRVRDQVEQHLLEAVAIGVHVPVVREPVGVAVQRDGLLAGLWGEERDHFLDRVGERDRLGRDRHLAGLDSREVEDLVDQRKEMPAGFQDVGDVLGLALIEAVQLEQLSKTYDRVHRGAQLVAHPR